MKRGMSVGYHFTSGRVEAKDFQAGRFVRPRVGPPTEERPLLDQPDANARIRQIAGRRDTREPASRYQSCSRPHHGARLRTSSRPASANFRPALRLTRR